MEAARSAWRRDALAALTLAFVLSAAWTLADWPNLSALRLPDTDDVMRLQQVRDWLAGQRFADVSQHRMGDGSTPMHWSRLADMLPASLIALLAPLAGRHAAELVAVLATPALLFAAALFLLARIARRAAGPDAAVIAAVIGAMAYPATTIFLPGRIDHHGLQVVLLLAGCLASFRPTVARGAAVGALAAASLVIGLETAPLFAALGLYLVAAWVACDERDARCLAGLGAGATLGLLIARAIFATYGWDYPACDGFGAPLWRAALPLALAPFAIALTGRRLGAPGQRAAAAAAIGLVAATLAFALSPACLSPYGGVDARLASLWLAHVGEAQSPFTAPLATTIGYLGLTLAGIAATAWRLRREPSRAWATLLLLQLTALAIATIQLRGAYAGAMLGAPALAAAIGFARRRGALPVAGAWLASAGLLYPLAAQAVVTADRQAFVATCDPSPALATLAAQPLGTVIAPIDLGPNGIARTPHRFLAAPYHRNAAGDLAVLNVFLKEPAAARPIAHDWHADYLLLCPGDLDIFSPDGRSLVRALERGRTLPWLRPIRTTGGALLYRIKP